MRSELGPRVHDVRRRIRRVERRELRSLRRWLERTSNVTRLSVVVFVPLLIAVVTLLSNAIQAVSFLLYPPLAAGTYTLFADPEGPYSSPGRFVGGMSVGALCGWAALALSARFLYHVEPAALQVHAGAAALGIFLTALATWLAGLELPTAFSTALLVLITGTSQLAYVVGVMLSSSLVAAVFVVWRDRFYEQRARYLYGTTNADDHVLVPMLGRTAEQAAMLGARLAAAHEAGKVVLLDVVDEAAIAAAERDRRRESTVDDDRRRGEVPDDDTAREPAEAELVDATVDRLESQAASIRDRLDVPCEVVVAGDGEDLSSTVVRTADETNCDLVVAPFEGSEDGAETGDEGDDGAGQSAEAGRVGSAGQAALVRDLFRSDLDVVAFRSATGQTDWRRVMVPVRRPGDVAHAMIDYAERLAGRVGTVSVCTCIDDERDRRRAELRLADLVETATVRCETRVSRSTVEAFLQRNDAHYDLVFLGASTDRSAASRFVSRPTFERVTGVETDVAVVHRG